ncbi:hypothetical protein C6W27_09025 [Bacillus paralicheniformis]|nr:hypothetical protein C6W27_09025 [Bacillus paralicheniformis]
MVQINYSQRKRRRTRLHTGTMTPIPNDSRSDYLSFKAEQDRHLHFGDPFKQEQNENKGER